MKMFKLYKVVLFVMLSLHIVSCQKTTQRSDSGFDQKSIEGETKSDNLRVGAERLEEYLPLLESKNVGLVVNQTSVVNHEHLLDLLISKGVNVQAAFAPEHGFRGKADAGEKIEDGKDSKTGTPIYSLYGKNKKPSDEMLSGLDVVVFDIQDVGVRFYTYISTLHLVMEACAKNNISVIVLDRPNPNAHYVDGPVLKKEFTSFVGMHPIPVVYGMTIGELAQMINGEGWLEDGMKCSLKVITCDNYNHETYYSLPIKPSPNLPNDLSIALYPSLCFFEGTTVSVGRGTKYQFQIYGHPLTRQMDFNFIPVPNEGAKSPKHNGEVCYGMDLSQMLLTDFRQNGKLDLSHLINMHRLVKENGAEFFNSNNFFDLLAGTDQLKESILNGLNEEQIRETWKEDLDDFKEIRSDYLLYH